MIGKIMKAASFSRCVHYVTGKEEAKILASDGVLLTTTQDIIDSFEFQRQMNPRITKPVGHIALSFLPKDKDKLTDKMMTKIAREYMELMGIKETQFLLMRHFDNGNPLFGAQSNSRGGMIVVGIDDKTGRINPLSFVEVQETSNLLGSLASEGVVPQILLDIENVQPEGVRMESIKHGASVPRNKLLFNHGINLLPYTGVGSGITRALKFTPDIKFVNDEMLNEFVVTVERRNVGETEANRYSDREDRDKRDEEDRDNSLSSKYIENNEATKRDKDGVEETEDRTRVVRTPYKQLPSVQKNIIQFCAIPRTAKEIMDHIGYYNNSKNMTMYVRPLLEMGYIEMTEPDKPKSKNQKYRKVRKV